MAFDSLLSLLYCLKPWLASILCLWPFTVNLTGAISGAYLGIEAIPESWRGKLESSGYLEELAEKLCAL